MRTAIHLAERGLLPDFLVRQGIRRLLRHRLEQIDPGDCEAHSRSLRAFVARMKEAPIALHTAEANEQHYELPPVFFEKVLGRHLKYSACYFPPGAMDLDEAEEAMLALTCRRAGLEDGQRVLELGCGWGSLTVWMAESFPRSQFTAISNSSLQRHFIEARCRQRGLDNVRVLTCDINDFEPEERFARVVSVEMFEHLRNYEKALERVAAWLEPDGLAFLHVFCHRDTPYIFQSASEDDWMGRYFFTGGLMPSDDLLLHFQKDLSVCDRWRLSGTHYARTARCWLQNMDARRAEILPVLAAQYGEGESEVWFRRWRFFFMACEELFGFDGGEEWWVAHYLFEKKRVLPEFLPCSHPGLLHRE